MFNEDPSIVIGPRFVSQQNQKQAPILCGQALVSVGLLDVV